VILIVVDQIAEHVVQRGDRRAPHVELTSKRTSCASKGCRSLRRRLEELTQLDALRWLGPELRRALLEQLVDLAAQRLGVDMDRDDGPVPIIVREFFSASLQDAIRAAARLLQLVLAAEGTARPRSLASAASARSLVTPTSAGETWSAQVRRRTPSSRRFPRRPGAQHARAQHTEQLVVGVTMGTLT
jgi:hypothetical protein